MEINNNSEYDSESKKKSKGSKDDEPLTKEKVLKELFSTAIYILIVLGISFLLIKYVGQRTVVDGRSMENTLHDGDSLWVNKIIYKFKDPERFDIVVFPPNENDASNIYIKRIIGLPGETVYIDTDGSIYINGELLEESFGNEVIDINHIGRAGAEVTLGVDEYFVMGDNRNNSVDSRFISVGNVHRSQFIGKAVFRLYPFSKFGTLK